MRNKTITLLAAFAVVVTIWTLWFTNRAVTPTTPTWDDVVLEAKLGGYKLITTEELASLRRKGTSGLLLVDTRQDWEYRTGHIEGAILFPIEPTAWSRWKNKNDLALLLGPDKSRTIVFY